MRKLSTALLWRQLVIGFLLSLLTKFSPYEIYFQSVMDGVLMSCITAIISWLIFRRMPIVIRRKDFYRLMLVCEITKWLTVVGLTIVFMTRVDIKPFGILMGFGITYWGSYILMLTMK